MGTDNIGNCLVKIEFAGKHAGPLPVILIFHKHYFRPKLNLEARIMKKKIIIMTFFILFFCLKVAGGGLTVINFIGFHGLI